MHQQFHNERPWSLALCFLFFFSFLNEAVVLRKCARLLLRDCRFIRECGPSFE